MTRRQAVGFLVVLALIGAGLLLRARTGTTTGTEPDLRPLQAAAGLAPCPTGLSPELPDLRLACLGGGPAVSLTGPGPGRPMLVNIWATWCGPCVREVPVLVGFAAKAGPKVAVVGVDTEDKPSDALVFARQYAMRYPSVIDADGRVLRRYGGGPPITLLVDAGGRVVFTHRGELTSLAQLEGLVSRHLGVAL